MKGTGFKEAINYLDLCHKHGLKRDFSVLNEVLEKLGSPQNRLKIIHIAGTNGKGSVCAMLSSVLMEEGLKIGFFSSPHLEAYNERFKINGKDISDEDFHEIVLAVKKASGYVFKTDGEYLSHFEVLTCACMYYFCKENVDYLLLEAGVGGLHDATNLVKTPVLSIITSIGFDHMEYLGDTIEKIVHEKAGIIKNNLPTVLYFSSKEVYNVIKSKCDEKCSELFFFSELNFEILSMNFESTMFSISCEHFHYNKIELSLLGQFQVLNAATALLAIHALKKLGVKIKEQSVLLGLKKARWAGRMEIVNKAPLIILDGAHNTDGIKMAEKAINELFSDENLTIVLGFSKDKDYAEMINIIAGCARNLILTKASFTKKALNPDILLRSTAGAAYTPNIIILEDFRDAMEAAISIGDPVIVLGSLYLIGDVRGYLKSKYRILPGGLHYD